MLDVNTLQGLLGPTYRVAADPTNNAVIYALAGNGDLYAHSGGRRRQVTKDQAPKVKKLFDIPATPEPVIRPTSLTSSTTKLDSAMKNAPTC